MPDTFSTTLKNKEKKRDELDDSFIDEMSLNFLIVVVVTFRDENYKKSMEEAHSLSVTINKNLENYDRKLRPNAGGECYEK